MFILICYFFRPETPPPSFVQVFDGPPSIPGHQNETRREVRRLPSAPLPHHNLFRRASRSGGDIVASETGLFSYLLKIFPLLFDYEIISESFLCCLSFLPSQSVSCSNIKKV